MAMWTLQAGAVSVTTEKNVLTVVFADRASHPSQYLLLQKNMEAEALDGALADEPYYVEASGQDTSFYGGITEFRLSDDKLILEIDAVSQGVKLSRLEVSRRVDDDVWEKIRSLLQIILSGAIEATP